MAFNEVTAKRIREVLLGKGVSFIEKKMFMGVCFMVNDKLCCGTHIDVKSGEDVLLCRVGEVNYAKSIESEFSKPMDMSGKPMKGFVFITEQGFTNEHDLEYWIQLCLDYNPIAKKSKKK